MFFYDYKTNIGKIYISADKKNILEISFNKPNYDKNETPLIKNPVEETKDETINQEKSQI